MYAIRSYYDDDNGIGKIAAEVLFDKLRDLASALPYECYDFDGGIAAADDHSHQGRFSHTASGKDSQLLPFSAAEQPVNGFDADAEGFIDHTASHGGDRGFHDRFTLMAENGSLFIDGIHKGIDDTSEQGITDA